MRGINQTFHVGNLTKDPVIKTTATGERVAFVTIACNYSMKQGEEWVDKADFISYSFWGNICNYIEKLTKGTMVAVTGSVKVRVKETEGGNVWETQLKGYQITAGGREPGRRESADQTELVEDTEAEVAEEYVEVDVAEDVPF